MRHDIRTPLTGIVGFSDIIKSETLDPTIEEYADNLIASSHALLDLMDEVLEAIRVSSGEIPQLKKKFSLENTLRHVVNLNQAKASSKRWNFSLEYDSNIPKYVIGDHIRIHRIALELVANALNFTDSGYVRLSVQLAKQVDNKIILKMVVEDPDMDGYEVTHHIRVQELAKKNHIPIIALTAHAFDENKQRCIEAGMNAVLTKPLTEKNCVMCLIPLSAPENRVTQLRLIAMLSIYQNRIQRFLS